MPATAEALLALLLSLPGHAGSGERPPDRAMLEFLALFTTEDGRLDDPASIESLVLPADDGNGGKKAAATKGARKPGQKEKPAP